MDVTLDEINATGRTIHVTLHPYKVSKRSLFLSQCFFPLFLSFSIAIRFYFHWRVAPSSPPPPASSDTWWRSRFSVRANHSRTLLPGRMLVTVGILLGLYSVHCGTDSSSSTRDTHLYIILFRTTRCQAYDITANEKDRAVHSTKC